MTRAGLRPAAQRCLGSTGAVFRRPPVPLLLGLLVLAFYAPVVLLGRAFYLKDAQLVVYPTRLFLRERLLAFDLPEWLPHLDMGMPFLANPSNGVLYPLNVLLLLPAPYCVGLFVVAHSVIAIIGAWALLQHLGVRPAAAALGAMAFALGGYMVSLTWVANYMMSLAWLPLVALLVSRSLRRNKLSDAAVAGFAWALQILSGEPQGVVLTGWFVLALVIAFPHSRSPKWRQFLLLALAVAIACCVAMPQILAALELIPRSRRGTGIDLAEASHWSLHPLRLLELLVPNLFGNPIHFDEFLGFFMDDENSPLHRDPWFASPYLGSAVLLFALAGLMLPRQRHRYWVRALGVLLAFSLLLALGRHTPVFGYYFRFVPGARLFRYPAKIFGLCAAIIPLLGAAGFDTWCSQTRKRHIGYVAVFFVMALMVGAAAAPWAGRVLHDFSPNFASTAATKTIRQSIGIELGTLVLVTCLLVLMRRSPKRGWIGPTLGLATLQIARANLGAYATVPAHIYSEPALATLIRASTPSGEPTRIMTDVATLALPNLDAAPGPEQAQAFVNALMKDLGIAFGIGYADSYISSEEGPKYNFWKTIGPYRRQMLDVFGIHHVLLPNDIALPEHYGLRRMALPTPIGAAVYENTNALPFAYAVAGAIAVDNQNMAIKALRDPRIAQGLCAVLDDDANDLPTKQGFGRVGACRTLAPLADRTLLDCELAQAGYVVVNASHHPNFVARLDGTDVPIARANAFVMALRVPAGNHRIELEYSEKALLPGCVVSFCGILIGLLLQLRSRPKPRPPGLSQSTLLRSGARRIRQTRRASSDPILERHPMNTTPATSAVFAQLKSSLRAAAEMYSNVHRGSGQFSNVTTQLFEHARHLVLQHVALQQGDADVIFASPQRAKAFSAQLGTDVLHCLSSQDIGLPLAVRALVVSRNALNRDLSFEQGGGTARLVSKDWVIWAATPGRCEAGTPAIMNVIAFARGLQLCRRHRCLTIEPPAEEPASATDILFRDELEPFSGQELLEKVRQTHLGARVQVPTSDGTRAYVNLDNAASTPTFAPIWEAFTAALILSAQGRQEVVQSVRTLCARALGAPLADYDVLFTSNTTEAINIVARSLGRDSEPNSEPVILNTLLEHNSNELPWRTIAGHTLLRLPVDEEGLVDLNNLRAQLQSYNQTGDHGTQRIRLVAVSGCSNVLGTCNDLVEIGRITHEYGARLLVDGAQLVAHRKVELKRCNVDYFAFSGHKMYAPFGSGALVVRKGLLALAPNELALLESSGDENAAGISAMGKAFVLLERLGMDVIQKEEQLLTAYALEQLANVRGLRIFGVKDAASARFAYKGGVIAFCFDKPMPKRTAQELAKRGIGVRYGCHCAHLLVKRLHKLPPFLERVQWLIIKLFPKMELPGVVRASLGIENTREDVDVLVAGLNEVAANVKSPSSASSFGTRMTSFIQAAIGTVYS